VRRRGVRFTRTFVIPDAPYTVTELPDLGAGGGTAWLNESGDVTGWVTGPNDRRRPAVWRRAQFTVVPAADTGHVVAWQVNGAGVIAASGVDAGGRRAALPLAPGGAR
jgi:hypothetical protein